MIDWPAKQPNETLDYQFDWTNKLAVGETIASHTITLSGGGSQTSTRVGSLITVILSGGSAGTVVRVTNQITTSAGRIEEVTAVVPIGGGPIDLAAAKAHLRVDLSVSDDDALIDAYLQAAVAMIEDATGRLLTPRIVKYSTSCFAGAGRHQGYEFTTARSGVIRLPRLPVQQVISIGYDDTAGVDTAFTGYRLGDITKGEVLPAAGTSWPITGYSPSAVRITYLAGYNPEELPRPLLQAVMLTLGHFYANREAVTIGNHNLPTVLPLAVDALIQPYRSIGMA